MNSNYVGGINEQQVEATINRVMSDLEKLDFRFEQIDISVSKTKNYYKCNSGDEFRKRYDSIRLNYDVVKKNMLAYVDDLRKLMKNYERIDTSTNVTMSHTNSSNNG